MRNPKRHSTVRRAGSPDSEAELRARPAQSGESIRPTRQSQEFWQRLIGSILLFGFAAYCFLAQHIVISSGRRATSSLSRRPSVFDGPDAVVLGLAAVALGLINLAVGWRSRFQLHLFWTGLLLGGGCLLYGLWRVI